MEDVFTQHSKKILQALNQQRAEGKFCDATLDVGGRSFRAHCGVLVCCSHFFHSIYGNVTPASVTVSLPESCSGAFELLLDFIYTGELPLTRENLDRVLSAAKELAITDAVELCQRFQQRWRDSENDQNEQVSRDPGAAEEMNGHAEVTFGPDDTEVGEKNASLNSASQPAGNIGGDGRVNCTVPIQSDSSSLAERRPRRSQRANAAKRSFSAKKTMQDAEGLKSKEKKNGGNTHAFVMETDAEIPDLHISEEETAEDDDHDLCKEVDEDYVPEKKGSGKSRRKSSVPRKLVSAEAVPDSEKPDSNGNVRTLRRMNRKAPAEPVECPTCHKKFLSKYYLKVHNRRHTGEKPFQCSKCGKCYFRKENLTDHEARDCQSRTKVVFHCRVCQEPFERRVQLRIHMVTHTNQMPYKCFMCSQEFMQKSFLRTHMIKVHGASKPHACSSCTKSFLSRTELRLHEASKHRGEKLFVCEECGHRASSRNGLQMHIKAKHRNERPFVCEFCNHAFTQKANLNMHLRIHTGEKPFQCHLCGKTFRTQASLDKHNRTHTGERPFHCEFCEQRFTEKGPLLRHIASKHQEGRPHFCQICGKTFKAIEQLRVHVRRHKGMRKFECTECGYKFTRQAHLRRHMEIHNRVGNYNPRQRRLRNLIIEDEKVTLAALRNPNDVEPSPPAEILLVAITQGGASAELPDQRICEGADFAATEVVEQELIVAETELSETSEAYSAK
ncbi:telomere zinc finger-associated protein isoform X2 [Latimeria chalumnae]|uniref:telomere zinc finger-associated protein isoform X2 n=1 Tax=Latimeria chalumnae TaxID=7897 RepID=UPI0003C155FC|nr:PREDICTED: zinc finger and BTB domain-containing protein 48 isoform X2 [Latimeria chalumnae]|eukprot:XP_005994258.1 PREDICTED: zinc finger and BTB domain-containing protein 48 isoform X2 [Latimeria chalumnae]